MTFKIPKDIKQSSKKLFVVLIISSVCVVVGHYINIAIKHERDVKTLERAVAIQHLFERFRESCGSYPSVFVRASMENLDLLYARGCQDGMTFSSFLSPSYSRRFPEYFSQFEYCSTLTRDSRKCNDDATWKSRGYLLSFLLESDWPVGAPLRKGINVLTPDEFFDATRKL